MYVPAARLDCMNYLTEQNSYDQQVHYMLCMDVLMPSLSPDVSSAVFCTFDRTYVGRPRPPTQSMFHTRHAETYGLMKE